MHPIALLKRRREIQPSLPLLRHFPIGGVEIVCYVLCKNTGLEKMSTVGRKRGAGAERGRDTYGDKTESGLCTEL